MKLFNTLAIETGARCNRSCVFCPNHETQRPDEYMSLDTIRKMADELAALKYKGRITPYIYNEPMHDERLLYILRLLSSTVPGAHVMVSTNGDYLKRKGHLEALYAAGARQVLVNIYSASDMCGNPTKEARGIVLAQRRAAMIAGWFAELGVDTTRSVYAPAPRGARIGHVEHKYGVTADTTRLAKFELQNRSGNISWFAKPLAAPLPKMCVRPWRVLNINWTGQALLCCNDYHGITDFGNVATSSLTDIWNSPEFNTYRLFLQNKRRDLPLCQNCDYGTGSYPHMVEPVSFGKHTDKEFLKLSGFEAVQLAPIL